MSLILRHFLICEAWQMQKSTINRGFFVPQTGFAPVFGRSGTVLVPRPPKHACTDPSGRATPARPKNKKPGSALGVSGL
jgi:hypothetical protein